MGDYFMIEPEFHWWTENNKKDGVILEDMFYYSSENNPNWLTIDDLKVMLSNLEVES